MPPIETQQLARTLNQILALAVLRSGPQHGYQIALEIEEQSAGAFHLLHGTLYPILHGLEKEGLIDGEWDAGAGRRRRKIYALTAAGREHLRERVAGWDELHERLSAFLAASAALHPRTAANQ
jgi:DNA-binding PadR family transcriptional regulator